MQNFGIIGRFLSRYAKFGLTLSPLTSGRGVAPSDKCHFKPRSSRLLLSPGGQWTSNSVRSCVAKARVITHFRRGGEGVGSESALGGSVAPSQRRRNSLDPRKLGGGGGGGYREK